MVELGRLSVVEMANQIFLSIRTFATAHGRLCICSLHVHPLLIFQHTHSYHLNRLHDLSDIYTLYPLVCFHSSSTNCHSFHLSLTRDLLIMHPQTPFSSSTNCPVPALPSLILLQLSNAQIFLVVLWTLTHWTLSHKVGLAWALSVLIPFQVPCANTATSWVGNFIPVMTHCYSVTHSNVV